MPGNRPCCLEFLIHFTQATPSLRLNVGYRLSSRQHLPGLEPSCIQMTSAAEALQCQANNVPPLVPGGRALAFIVVTVLCLVFCYILVGLRVWCRAIWLSNVWGLDDTLACIGLVSRTSESTRSDCDYRRFKILVVGYELMLQIRHIGSLHSVRSCCLPSLVILIDPRRRHGDILA